MREDCSVEWFRQERMPMAGVWPKAYQISCERVNSPKCLRVQPFLKMGIQSFEHLPLHVPQVRELGPAGDVVGFAGAFELGDEFVNKGALVLILIAQVFFARVRSLLLAMFGS